MSSVHTRELRQVLLLIWVSKLEVCLLRSRYSSYLTQGLQRTRSTFLPLEETSEAGVSVVLLSGRDLVTIASPALAPAWYPEPHHNLSFLLQMIEWKPEMALSIFKVTGASLPKAGREGAGLAMV